MSEIKETMSVIPVLNIDWELQIWMEPWNKSPQKTRRAKVLKKIGKADIKPNNSVIYT